MKSLVESIIGRRGVEYKKILPKIERALENEDMIERLAEKHQVSFEAMKEVFDKIKDTVKRFVDEGDSDDEKFRKLDEFLENEAADEYFSEDHMKKITSEINKDRDKLDEIIEDVSEWMFKYVR